MKLLAQIFLGLMLLVSQLCYAGDEGSVTDGTGSITIGVGKTPVDGKPAIPPTEPAPGKGSRVPSAPVLCVINFDDLTIELAGCFDEIIEYALCDLDGNCILSTESESAFVGTLASLKGDYYLELTSEDYTYTGILTL